MLRLVTNNLLLKLLSLVVAILLWLAVQGDADTTTAVSVRVQYRNIPPQLEISSDLPETAYIEVRGPTARLNSLNLNTAAVALDLSTHQKAGERTYSILSVNAKVPPGVTFLRAIPSQIRIRLEARVAKQVPVTARFDDLPAGHTVVFQDISPPTVQIVGPESHVNAISRVETDAIDWDETDSLAQSFHVPVYTGDPLVHFDQKTVSVLVKVRIEKNR